MERFCKALADESQRGSCSSILESILDVNEASVEVCGVSIALNAAGPANNVASHGRDGHAGAHHEAAGQGSRC
jgi:hypothetical protein